ncbi:hypothetical protein VU04_10470 [Desulfobulbus sp. TB]|nr:hypothetical protein [Desulfobulbus sp. TB]
MCNFINLTKINQKRKKLATSIFARFGEKCKKERVVPAKEGRSQKDKEVLHCAGS